jgi:beta-phosphoglucomutase-like phosphatase (HAD superfamily)
LHLFELVVTQDVYEQSKPSPQAYLTALSKMALNPEECIAVEDSPRGASSAVAAGLSCFVVPTFLTDVTLCPDKCLILDNISDLKDRIGTREVFPFQSPQFYDSKSASSNQGVLQRKVIKT